MRADQLIGNHRMRLMAVVEAAPSVREGCRRAGIHHSTYYQWLKRLDREGIAGLIPKMSRTVVRSPARIRFEAEVVALALANPPWGPKRLFFELTQRQISVGSVSQVWRILCSYRLNTRQRRYRLLATTRGLTEADLVGARTGPVRRWVGQLHAEAPGDLVQMDCFQIGRLKEARLGVAKRPGMVWQYTAIDVASSFVWAELHTTAHNPSSTHTTALAYRLASELGAWEWNLHTVTTDRGTEFRNRAFTEAVESLGAEHRLITAGRPQSNGKVEQVQNTILQECWKPGMITYPEPSLSGLRQDLTEFLTYYNNDRPHTGKWNQGKPPIRIIKPNPGNQP